MLKTIQLLDTFIAVAMTLLLLLNTALTSSYIKESANPNVIDRIMLEHADGSRVGDQMQLHDTNNNGNT